MAVNNEDKKVPNENKPNDKKTPNFSYLGVLLGMFFIIFALNTLFISLFNVGNTANSTILSKSFVEGLKEATYSTVEKDTVFRCVGFTPIFDKDGVKKYEVRFKDMNSSLFFTSVVDAVEIDEKANIVEDAKYEGSVSYLYVENAFEETTKDMEQEDKDKRIISLLNSKSEYAAFGEISEIKFMYGEGVTDYSFEKATESLNEYVDGLINPKTEEEEANKNKKLSAIPVL